MSQTLHLPAACCMQPGDWVPTVFSSAHSCTCGMVLSDSGPLNSQQGCRHINPGCIEGGWRTSRLQPMRSKWGSTALLGAHVQQAATLEQTVHGCSSPAT